MNERYLLYCVAGVALSAWLTGFLASRYIQDVEQRLDELSGHFQVLSVSYARHISNGGHVHTEEPAHAGE